MSGHDESDTKDWWTQPPRKSLKEYPVDCVLCCGWFFSILILGIFAQGGWFSGTPLQALGIAAFVLFTIILTIYWVIIKGKGPFR